MRVDILLSWEAAYKTLSKALLDMANWCQRNRDELSDIGLERIIEWQRHELIEWRRANDNFDLTLFGRRSTASIATRILAYEQEISRIESQPNISWNGLGLDRNVEHGGHVYKFIELLSSSALAEEGREMRHCVAAYATACKTGKSAIFSVRMSGRRVGTIEIAPVKRKLRQAFGKANSKLGMEAFQALSKWVRLIQQEESK